VFYNFNCTFEITLFLSMLSKLNVDSIRDLVTQDSFVDLISSKEFYFKLASDCLNKWLSMPISDQVKERLSIVKTDYKEGFLMINEEEPELFEIKELLLELISYCDRNAKDKNLINKYLDKRSLAKASIYMNEWISKLVDLKMNRHIETGSVRNAMEYLNHPELECTVLYNEHRRQISENLFGKPLRSETFVEELKAYFKEFGLKCDNDKNYTHLLTMIVYHFKQVWIEEIVGLMASDGTGWQEDLLEEMNSEDFVALWNSKRPTGTAKTIKLMRERLKTGQSVYIYYSVHGKINYFAEIIDIAENDKELTEKNWPSTFGNVHWYRDAFHKYTDGKKRAYIVFLAKQIAKTSPIPQKEFRLFKEYSYPTQDNLSPISTAPDLKKYTLKSTFENKPSEMNYPLNQILYGPPGTGKTFHTVNKALEILDYDITGKSRQHIKDAFNKCVLDGRVVFTTFHQSMSYEDFIEGIKPLKPKGDSREIAYDVVPGIFRKLCDSAEKALKGISVASQDESYDKFLEYINQQIEANGRVLLKSKSNTEVILHNISDDYIYASPRLKDNVLRNYPVSKEKILILDANYEVMDDIVNVVGDIRDVVKGVGHTYYWAVLKAFKAFKKEKNLTDHLEKETNKNYVLIIDEINRGNVSQIFGELITLIEEDKRAGKRESLEITLPYSNDRFSVPPNVYIIGTMNTADRSVEALDTALRRRFVFEEMVSQSKLLSPSSMIFHFWSGYEQSFELHKESLPKEIDLYELLGANELLNITADQRHDHWIDIIGYRNQDSFDDYSYNGVNLKEVLDIINLRIQRLLTSEHLIGHSYFMSVCSTAELKDVFYQKIIPLLQEYFYGDIGKLGLILGKGFIKKKIHLSDDIFAVSEYEMDSLDSKDVYEVLDYRKHKTFTIGDGAETRDFSFEDAMNILVSKQR
jgi:5-methylcytosine-specific restriction protein B